MATVRMKKGDMYADICNNPECIENAKLAGYSLCEEKSPEQKVEEVIENELKPDVEKVQATTHKRASAKK